MTQIQNRNLEYKTTILRPKFDLPHDWSILTLKNLVSLLKDGTHTPPPRIRQGIPLLASESIHDGIVDFNKGVTYISGKDYLEIHKSFEIKRGDLLLTIVGTLGRVSMVNTDDKFSIQRSVALIRTNDKILPVFLYYFLQTEYFQQQLTVRANATAQAGVYLGKLKEIPISYPIDKKYQLKIACILSKVDELIRKTDQVIVQTQRLKKGLMQKLLTKGIGHTKFKDIILGLKFLKLSVPENWTVANLEDITQIIDTPHYTSLYFSHGVPVIRTTDCDQSGEINYAETKFTSEEEYEKRRKIIDPEVGDVLYTREAPPGIGVYVDRKKKTHDFIEGIRDWLF